MQVQFSTQDDLNTQLCHKLQPEGQKCSEIVVDVKSTRDSVVSVLFFVLLVLILLAAAGTVVYFYRRRLRRDVNKEIKMQVETAVDHYFALSESAASAK
jgi:preprotein translocase subunit SecY